MKSLAVLTGLDRLGISRMLFRDEPAKYGEYSSKVAKQEHRFCDGDVEAFAQIDPRIEVTREHEIAYGDSYCDHCSTLKE